MHLIYRSAYGDASEVQRLYKEWFQNRWSQDFWALASTVVWDGILPCVSIRFRLCKDEWTNSTGRSHSGYDGWSAKYQYTSNSQAVTCIVILDMENSEGWTFASLSYSTSTSTDSTRLFSSCGIFSLVSAVERNKFRFWSVCTFRRWMHTWECI